MSRTSAAAANRLTSSRCAQCAIAPLVIHRARRRHTVIDFSQDYFSLFGLPARYHCDARKLDAAYRKLQSEVHPDLFAAAGESERRLALQSSARVNEAYRALRDPVDRALHLLSLHRIQAMSE